MRPLGLTAHLASWMVQVPGSRRKLCLIAPGGKWPRKSQGGSLWCSTQGQAHTGVHTHKHTHITHTICAYAHVSTYTQIILVENLIWSTCYLISIPYFYLHESYFLLLSTGCTGCSVYPLTSTSSTVSSVHGWHILCFLLSEPKCIYLNLALAWLRESFYCWIKNTEHSQQVPNSKI